jgi:hypothetical protein
VDIHFKYIHLNKTNLKNEYSSVILGVEFEKSGTNCSKQTNRQTDKLINIQTYKHTNIQTYKHTNIQIDK